MVKVTVADDRSAVYLDPCMPGGDLHSKLIDSGIFYEFNNNPVATVPLSSQSAMDLRESLRGQAVELSRDHAKILAQTADGAIVVAPALLLSRDGKFAIVNEPALDMRGFSGWSSVKINEEYGTQSLGHGVYRVNISKLPTLRSVIPPTAVANGLAQPESALEATEKAPSRPVTTSPPNNSVVTLPITPPVNISIANQPDVFVEIPALKPFPSYDGTLASLKNVKLTEYSYIQSDLKRYTKTPKKSLAARLHKLGLNNAFDVLHYYPHRYIDRSNPELISRMAEGVQGTVIGTVVSIVPTYVPKGGRGTPYVQIIVKDIMGDTANARFFRQLYLTKVIKTGDQVILQGVPKYFGRTLSLSNAQIEKVNADGMTLQVIPVYPQSEVNNIKTAQVMKLVQETVSRIKSHPIPEFMTEEVRSYYQLPVRMDAYQSIHFPSNGEDAHGARRRLEYEELLRLQLFIQQRKKSYAGRKATLCGPGDYPETKRYLESLPYPLTGAQSRALEEIFHKLELSTPMNCLLQGDVGSGKSTVANATALKGVEAGYQVALMAPTEILAEQLYDGISSVMGTEISPRTGNLMNIRFLGNKTTAKNKRIIGDELRDGLIDIVVGTSSLLFDREFKNLGVVIIDEQHRFGVEQREALKRVRKDGLTPHLLSMSATPIPRSSAMVVYGDMDIVVLDELPPGRTPISTYWVDVEATETVANPEEEHWHTIREQVQAGHQAYVVASLVEDNETLAAQSVEDAYEMLNNVIFPDLEVGMVHGRQNRKDRKETMDRFSAGTIDILVSTTVIEVGVNVPNATVMVVLDPGRFGIAQLHQIRGRVGRSTFPSTCYLVGTTATDIGWSRLQALVESTDGFYLAEKDLELRGEGTLFGSTQSGESDLKLASLQRSLATLKVAKDDASQILDTNPQNFDLDVLRQEVDIFMKAKEIKS